MKKLIYELRGKRIEVSYQDSERGIMLSWVGSGTNLVDELTKAERKEILIYIINL